MQSTDPHAQLCALHKFKSQKKVIVKKNEAHPPNTKQKPITEHSIMGFLYSQRESNPQASDFESER
jgi:hypothetical protein